MTLQPVKPENYQKGIAWGGLHERLLRRATVEIREDGTAIVDADSLAWRAIRVRQNNAGYVRMKPANLDIPRRLPNGGNEAWGPVIWEVLHKRAISALGRDILPDQEREWVALWIAAIPCGHCRAHASAYVMKVPPDLSSGEAYFAWGVELHNETNRTLGKPEVEVAAARKMWVSRVVNPKYPLLAARGSRRRRAA
jgi:hypothetical protein